LELKCLNRSIYCPYFKPFENKTTKECISDCNIDEFNIICNPTNNIVAINETYNKIMDNLDYLDLKNKLLKSQEKFIITGNNISFIFTTSEIEMKDLDFNYNYSSIVLRKSENIFKKKYLIPDELPIPILKIESMNNHSKNIELYYEFFNPLNLSQKLDLNLFSQNYIEIRIPNSLKQYKIDLILKVKNSGYNIFDLNDPFYTDICSVFTYNNSDISLSERKNLLDLSDEDLCLVGCNYSNIDIKTLKTI
jgi:hypothetical protein